MAEKNWYLIAGLEIILIALAASLLLNRVPHFPSELENAGLTIIYRPISTPEDIEPLYGNTIPPIAYTNVISFAKLGVEEKKKKFFELMLPAVLISRYKLSHLHNKIARCLKEPEPSEQTRQWLQEQMEFFAADDYQALLRKTEVHPVSIVLAQAAMESGWGESRFFIEANNVFGVWSFDPQEPRLLAREDREGRKVYVKKYRSLIESVDDYFLTIARGPYRRFRYARQAKQDPLKLINHLGRYSEQGWAYTRQLQEVIRKNDLPRFDTCRIDPQFIRTRS